MREIDQTQVIFFVAALFVWMLMFNQCSDKMKITELEAEIKCLKEKTCSVHPVEVGK